MEAVNKGIVLLGKESKLNVLKYKKKNNIIKSKLPISCS